MRHEDDKAVLGLSWRTSEVCDGFLMTHYNTGNAARETLSLHFGMGLSAVCFLSDAVHTKGSVRFAVLLSTKVCLRIVQFAFLLGRMVKMVAGGRSVVALYQSPMAVGLFHRAIATSPGCFAVFQRGLNSSV